MNHADTLDKTKSASVVLLWAGTANPNPLGTPVRAQMCLTFVQIGKRKKWRHAVLLQSCCLVEFPSSACGESNVAVVACTSPGVGCKSQQLSSLLFQKLSYAKSTGRTRFITLL